MTIDEFISNLNITMEVLPCHVNPSMTDDPKLKMHHWSCLLNRPLPDTGSNRQFHAFFSKGDGCRVWKMPTFGISCPLPKRSQIGKPYTGWMPYAVFMREKGTTVADTEQYEHCSEPERPRLDEVLDCIVTDHTDETFKDWAFGLGYEEDSREALATYEQCCKQNEELRIFLTLPHFTTLLEEVERL